MTRVIVKSLIGQPMLYRDFFTPFEAARWAKWAREAMPCETEILP